MNREHHLDDVISGLLDGELGTAEARAAEAHLAGCPRCAAELASVSWARRELRALPMLDPPFGLYERVLRRPSAAAPSLAGRRVGLGVLALSAAASIVLVGLSSPSERQVTPQVPELVEAHAVSASVGGDPLSELVPAGVPVTFRP